MRLCHECSAPTDRPSASPIALCGSCARRLLSEALEEDEEMRAGADVTLLSMELRLDREAFE